MPLPIDNTVAVRPNLPDFKMEKHRGRDLSEEHKIAAMTVKKQELMAEEKTKMDILQVTTKPADMSKAFAS